MCYYGEWPSGACAVTVEGACHTINNTISYNKFSCEGRKAFMKNDFEKTHVCFTVYRS